LLNLKKYCTVGLRPGVLGREEGSGDEAHPECHVETTEMQDSTPDEEEKSAWTNRGIDDFEEEVWERPAKKYCKKCGIVQEYRTKHCKQCRACIAKFDHHCFWIGSCVGELNHRKFIELLFLLTIEFIWALYYVIFKFNTVRYGLDSNIIAIITKRSTIFQKIHTQNVIKSSSHWESL